VPACLLFFFFDFILLQSWPERRTDIYLSLISFATHPESQPSVGCSFSTGSIFVPPALSVSTLDCALRGGRVRLMAGPFDQFPLPSSLFPSSDRASSQVYLLPETFHIVPRVVPMKMCGFLPMTYKSLKYQKLLCALFMVSPLPGGPRLLHTHRTL